MSNFDDLKLAVEALSGGKNTVLFDDDLGTGGESFPSIMVRIPQFTSLSVLAGAPDAPHSMFVVDDVPYPEIYFSKYPNIVMHDRAYSLPYKDPRAYVTFDQAQQFSEAKGKGWHLATNAEYAGIALWCLKNGFMPRGNNYFGGDHSATHERGVVTYTYNDNGTIRKGRTATGSGPASWNHDGTNAGICDLNGNVWEWAGGFRIVDGEIQIIPHNNAAKHVDQSASSTQWKAILQDGTIVAPGTANTLKFDNSVAGDNTQVNHKVGGTTVINTARTNPMYTGASVDVYNYFGYQVHTFETLAAKSGVTVPMLLKILGIAPPTTGLDGDNFWIRNYGERLPLRGGSWNDGAGAGVFALGLNDPRAASGHNVGFRAAFVSL